MNSPLQNCGRVSVKYVRKTPSTTICRGAYSDTLTNDWRMTMISMFPRITEHVMEYPVTGDYDINVWCDNDTEHPRGYWVVNLTFYPLVKGEEYDTVDTSKYHTLTLSVVPRGPKTLDAMNYLKALVNSDDVFDAEYTDWWSNECVLTDAPEIITNFVAMLPREER